jgi:hypothetical protein
MNMLAKWRKDATEGQCCNCHVEGLVVTYQRNPRSPLIHLGSDMPLCFICACTVGANAQDYPDQHPNHHHLVGPILGAISLLLSELKPPKKPRQPRASRIGLAPGVPGIGASINPRRKGRT